MKNYLLRTILISIFFVTSVQADGGGTSANSRFEPSGSDAMHQVGLRYVVIPFKSYRLTDSQKIEATFQIKCFERYLGVIRHTIDVSTSEVTTMIGALIERTPGSVCSNGQDIAVDAGYFYSGRRQNIVPIGNFH